MRRRSTAFLFALVAAVVPVSTPTLWGDDTAPESKPLTKQERIAKGRELVDGICSQCHELSLMYYKHLDREGWTALIEPMLYGGTPLSSDEFSMIVDFLTETYGSEEAR